ncbi:MAG: hypothetical protein QF732_04540 [Nitrospinaceae bacterium]|nr:hypothetical protein [Nitrospinaceae bacterium]
MKGFTLSVMRREDDEVRRQPAPDAIDDLKGDGRIMAVGRLASRFLDGLVADGPRPKPDLDDGLRVQILLNAVFRSSETGRRIDIPASENTSS